MEMIKGEHLVKKYKEHRGDFGILPIYPPILIHIPRFRDTCHGFYPIR